MSIAHSEPETLPAQAGGLRTDLCVLVAGGLFVLAVALRLSSLLNHDVAWWVYATGAYLDGAELYVELFEINPPRWVARMFGAGGPRDSGNSAVGVEEAAVAAALERGNSSLGESVFSAAVALEMQCSLVMK